MYEYLRQHPEIFMPEHKEPQFFGDDLTHLHERLSRRDYLELFKPATTNQLVGEATTWYLASSSAAGEIKRFAPDAKIVVMLRNPVDVMYSLHRELAFYGGETILDFEQALAAEEDRKRGQRIGPSRRAEPLFYRHTVRFPEQLQRYFDEFGRDAVHVILFDDFLEDLEGTYRKLLEFLGVDAGFLPDFTQVNESKRPRLAAIQALVVRPPGPLGKLVPALRRLPIAHKLRSVILMANSRAEERRPLDPALRRRLIEDVRPEVEQLGTMLERDLSSWLEIGAGALPTRATA